MWPISVNLTTANSDLYNSSMNIDVTARDRREKKDHLFKIDAHPDHCPICHRSLEPLSLFASTYSSAPAHVQRFCQIVYQCPSYDCQKLFMATYNVRQDGTTAYLVHLDPEYFVKQSFDDVLVSISPSFIEIFNQSIHAESQDLRMLVGIGLRKALEYLMKDYLIIKEPEHSEAIKKTPLAQCIKRYVTDKNLKECAKRAAWLGNDEAHYTRKWEEKDLKDLKILIELTISYIIANELTTKYMADMPEAISGETINE